MLSIYVYATITQSPSELLKWYALLNKSLENQSETNALAYRSNVYISKGQKGLQ
jgi:hypothetical protein